MATAELRYADEHALPGAVVGAVEVLDEHLATVAATVVRADHAVPVELPPGRYVAQGWLPSGEHVRASFVISAPGDTAAVALRPQHTEPDTDPVVPSDGWLRGWRYTGRVWQTGVDVEVEGVVAATASVVLRDSRSPSHALQVGGQGTSLITVVPPGTTVCVEAALDSGWRVRLPAGLDATLLGYLDRGDLAAAHTVAAEALIEPLSPLRALVLGYYLVRAEDARARSWVDDLLWAQPDSPDAAVLNAWLWRRDLAVEPAEIAAELRRAVSCGPPVLAGVLRLLVDSLRATGQVDRVKRMAEYLGAAVAGSLTAFTGRSPGYPEVAPEGADRLGFRARPLTTYPEGPPSGLFGSAAPFGNGVPFGNGFPNGVPWAPEGVFGGAFAGAEEAADEETDIDLSAYLDDDGSAAARLPVWHEVDAHTTEIDDELSRPRVTIRSNGPHTAHLDLFAPNGSPPPNVVVALRVDDVQHFLGTFDANGRCTLSYLPNGRWALALLDRAGPGAPLPVADAPAVVRAAQEDEQPEVMRVLLPNTTGTLVLSQDRLGRHTAELITHAFRERYLGIAYRAVDRSPRFAPLENSARVGETISWSVPLPGFDPRSPWYLVPRGAV
ncbi:hypothetical protein V5P93_002962 [Actinokineospora auranticolor]|uniref:Uncharacterized protein n=1 Tax=Actinokineospora auranticolor TaxID=155976 RepID=A0A2S6H0Z4_9PSEU|nr:hypothetical protein [Actinokineospora auranticolor]PPK71101.1 hypothetical protein CLV40_101287 [Actinokineospora auranticolor]